MRLRTYNRLENTSLNALDSYEFGEDSKVSDRKFFKTSIPGHSCTYRSHIFKSHFCFDGSTGRRTVYNEMPSNVIWVAHAI